MELITLDELKKDYLNETGKNIPKDKEWLLVDIVEQCNRIKKHEDAFQKWRKENVTCNEDFAQVFEGKTYNELGIRKKYIKIKNDPARNNTRRV